MKPTGRISIALAICIGCVFVSEAQTEIPLGVFLFDNTNVNYQQMKDDLGVTWVQGWGGWQNNPAGVEVNGYNLKAMAIRNNLYTYSKSQRSTLDRFLQPSNQQPDTVLHLKDATVYFYGKDIGRLKSLGILR